MRQLTFAAGRPALTTRRSSFATAAAAIAHLVLGPSLLACPVCFQVEPSATTDGVRAAVLVLVGITGAVLTACAAFAIRLIRRS